MAVAALCVVGTRDATTGASVWGYDSTGALVWSYDTANSTRKVTRDSSGNFYITGNAADNGDGDGTRNVWKLTEEGVYVSGAYAGSSGFGYDIDVDANYVYVSVNGGAYRLTTALSGETVIASSSGSRQAIAVDSSGNIYIGGGGIPPSLSKYNSSLVFQWSEDTNDTVVSIDFLSTNEIIVGTSDGEIRLYQADGSSPSAGTWAYVMDAAGPITRVVVDSNDAIYGARHNGDSSPAERFVALNTSGVRQWGITTVEGDLEDIFLSDTDVPYVVGDWLNGFNIFKVDTATHEIFGVLVNSSAETLVSIVGNPTFSYSPPGLLTDIEGFWTMNDDAASQVVTDESGNSRNGTSARNTSLLSTSGKVNGALEFVRANSDQIDLGDLAAWEFTANQDKTFSFWCNWDGSGSANFNVVFQKYSSAVTAGIVCTIARAQKRFRTFMFWPGGGSASSSTVGTDLTTGWFLCVVRVDRSSKLSISVNNGLYRSDTDISANAGDDLSNAQNLMLGEAGDLNANYERYQGDLDMVGVWNRLLSAEEEANLWNNGNGSENFLSSIPEITDQSTSSTITIGQAVSLFVTATGNPDPTYQWYKDGSPLSGETSSTLDFTAVAGSGGVYTCTATNLMGSDTSDDIVLSILPAITSQSSNTNVTTGQLLSLNVIATGYPAPTYQWYKDDVALPGETSNVYSTYALLAHAGTYKCIVTNVVGSVTSVGIVVGVGVGKFVYSAFNLNLDFERTS